MLHLLDARALAQQHGNLLASREAIPELNFSTTSSSDFPIRSLGDLYSASNTARGARPVRTMVEAVTGAWVGSA